GRINVTRQLVTESLIVTLLGGIAGLVVASAILKGLGAIGLAEIPRANEIRIDSTVIAFIFGVALIAGIVIGLAPLVRLFQINLSNVLRTEGRSSTSGRASRLARRVLVVAQVAFAFVLLIGAGLLLASFRRLLAVDPGFRPGGVITASINAPATKYPND